MIELDGRSLTPDKVRDIAKGEPVSLATSARERMTRVAAPLPGILGKKWSWLGAGVPPEDRGALVRAFIETHCGGVGDPLDRKVVRATMAARANVLAVGASGVRPQVVDVLVAMLNADIVPVVPAKGSVGSAAPAPLAHIARVACGYGGEAWVEGVRRPADEAMAGLPSLDPTEKEALALINGSTLSTALAALAVVRARTLLATAEAAAALSFEVVRADPGLLSARAASLRHHPGAIAVAARLRALVAGSSLVTEGRAPDPFSIRCTPAVLGAAWDALTYVEATVHRELNAACDNPLLLDDETLVEVGHFHGAHIALAMDHLKVALAQVCSLSERRIFRLTHGQLSGLPSFLVPETGLNSGLMLAQYTAASLTSECKGLAHPASVDSIPTVQHREDHVSMAPIAAMGAMHLADLLADVLAIELLCGAQGLDFHLSGEAVVDGELISVPPQHPAAGTRKIYDRVRAHVARWTDDRVLHPDLVKIGKAVREGAFS